MSKVDNARHGSAANSRLSGEGACTPSDEGISQYKIPRSCGVYQITCIVNGKIYVGSSVNMRVRWTRHRLRLTDGRHPNPHLQAAWDKYGQTAFYCSVLQFTEPSERLWIEQEWLDRTNCTDRRVGYNIYKVAGSPGESNAQVWEGFISPDGVETTIINLHRFCREHDLDYPSMLKLARGSGRLKSYKGWSHKSSIRQRPYYRTYSGFIAPDGLEIGPIENLARFCRKHGLEKSHMVALYRGKLLSHSGWTHVLTRERIPSFKTYSGFIDPSGTSVIISNLAAFCREQSLDVVHMREVRSRIRKSHKGWTWRDPA